jgi:chromosome segregation ATPase
MNAERGKGTQNQHVNFDGVRNDVNAKRNKAAFVGSVIAIAVLAVASFVMLGYEQYEFLVFDADRTQAKREVDRLREFAAKQETVNAAVSDELARREALLVSRQQQLEEFNTLTGQVVIVRNEIQQAREELNKTKETLAVEQGSLAAAKNETVALDERRQTLKRDISEKAKELSDSEVAVTNLKKQLVALGLDKTSALAVVDMANKQFAVEVERLTNVTVRVEAVRSSLQENERIADNAKTTLATLTLKIQAQEAKLAEQTAATIDAERMAASPFP